MEIFKKSDEQIIENFYRLSSRVDVAMLLEIDDKSLRYFLYSKKTENMYRTFKLPKKNGEYRTINSPNIEIKNIQKKLAYILALIYKVKPAAYGFIEGKNIVENAKQHTKKNNILNIDLKDFFNQIHFGRIKGMLTKKPYEIGSQAAMVIAQISCFNGKLPQGAPSSPVLTNMICSPLDTQLTRLAKKYEMKYTRYVDDITFSTYKNEFPKKIILGELNNLSLGSELLDLLNKNSFEVNEKKTFLNCNTSRQEVTGLIVNKFPNIKREYMKSVRAILYNANKYGKYEVAKDYIKKGNCKNKELILNVNNLNYRAKITSWFKYALKGKIEFIKLVRGKDDWAYVKYAKQMNNIFGESIFKLELYDELLKNVVVLETRDGERQGSGFIVKEKGLFTNFHVTETGDFYDVKTSDTDRIGVISKETNEIKSDKTIDYALYHFSNSEKQGFNIGDSKNINLDDEIILIGYPDYIKGDSPNIQRCRVASKTKYLGAPLYTVTGRIMHGASGGVVLNENYEVIGIIKGGVATMEESDTSSKQGFIPIDIVEADL